MINNLINSKLLAGFTATVALTGVMANIDAANALTKTYTDTFDLAPTDIENGVLSVQKFDGSLGILESVTIGFDAKIMGDALVESLDAQAQTLTFSVSGDLRLAEATNPLNNPLIAESVGASDSFSATVFDGSIDFGGTSGQSFNGLTVGTEGENFYSDQATLDFFTGVGNVNFLFSATTDSNVTGAANIASIISTKAGANVTVSYEYSEVVIEDIPEPSALLGLGVFAGLGLLTKKKVS